MPPSEPPACSTTFRPRYALTLSMALMWVKTVKLSRGGVGWWASETPEGASSLAFRRVGSAVRADAWGPGAQWAIERLPALLGRDDDPSGFRPLDPAVSDLTARLGVPRVGATGRWYEALATIAIVQRVVQADALTSIYRLGRRYGAPTPGGGPMPVFPSPAAVLRLADHQFHVAGVDRARARVVRVAAKYADRVERLAEVPPAEARSWLRRLPGVGPWTAALTTGIAAGDPDAVPVGDLHVPDMVCWALTGETGDDARMLEVLEPYAGHRGRIVRLVKSAGIRPPRHHPAPSRFDISRI